MGTRCSGGRGLRHLIQVTVFSMGVLAVPSAVAAQQVTRLSVGDLAQGDANSATPAISANGLLVAFSSSATTLVPGDTNAVSDIFVRDLKAGQTTRVSVGFDGTEADGSSSNPALSANGRFVAFLSHATNLVPADTNAAMDAFVHDRKTGQTTRVSVSSEGVQANDQSVSLALSADGSIVAFTACATNLVAGATSLLEDVYLHSLKDGTTRLVSVAFDGSQGNQDSNQPALSANGRYVAFRSTADNLLAAAATTLLAGPGDIFVRDMQKGELLTASVNNDGALGNDASSEPTLSANGRYVAFRSLATNLVAGDGNGVSDIFVRDLKAGSTTRASVASDGSQGDSTSSAPRLSSNGTTLAFVSDATNLVPGDTNGTLDIFVRDLKSQQTRRVSLAPDGAEADQFSFAPVLSPNARFVTWWSAATNLVDGDTNAQADVFLRDLKGETTTRVSVSGPDAEADEISLEPSLSANGRVVAFVSSATNLVPGDTNGAGDIFVWDEKRAQVTRASVDSDGVQADLSSSEADLSGNGRLLAFTSSATNLVPGDTNGVRDIFVHDLKQHTTTRASVSSAGDEANAQSRAARFSSNGRVLAFQSTASNLVSDDANLVSDIFVRDLKSGLLTRGSITPGGLEANGACSGPALSANGRLLAFQSLASNLVSGDTNADFDIFLKNLKTGELTRVSVSSDGVEANAGSFDPWLSANGRLVAFRSTATNLVPGDTNGTDDVFVHDTQSGQTTRISLDSAGLQGNFSSFEPVLSSNGRYVVFSSDANNLVPSDTNSTTDIFRHDRKTAQTVRVSLSADGAQTDDSSEAPAISANGRIVSFYSDASNLVPLDDNGFYDVFLIKLQ